MAAIQVVDFEDMVEAVREEIKYQSSDTTSLDRIRRDINMIYLDEVVPFKRWTWLSGHTDVLHKAYYSTGTVTVTNDSATVTLSTAPSVGSGSRANFLFSVEGYNEIYNISTHTAGATTVVLASNYTGTTTSTATFKIWSDTVALPTNCRETTEVWHDFRRPTLEALGIQELRRRVLESPKAAIKPMYYAPYDFFDPSTGDAETESDRYRILKIHPSLTDVTVTLHIDYVKQAAALENDGDEPVMAIEDRMVLVYGALARAWGRERNEERAMFNQQMFDRKLAAMAGRTEDGNDRPQITPDSLYMQKKRGMGSRRRMRRWRG